MNAQWIQVLLNMAPPAQGQGAPEGNPYSGLIMLAIMFAIFYFLLIRPQQKRVKEHQQMLNNLEKGAEVATSGGIIGRITNIADDVVTLQVAENTKINFQKSAIQQVLAKSESETKKGE